MQVKHVLDLYSSVGQSICSAGTERLYQVKRSIVCQEVWRAQKVAGSSKPLYEIRFVLGWGVDFVRNTAAVLRA
jgi:hypothetical protein